MARKTPLLGLVAGVASRIQSLKPTLEGLKPQYYQFYVREVIGSKIPVEEHVAAGLRDYFCDFATLEDIDTDIVPALEKGLLRAPEVILTGVLRPLVSSLPSHLDLASILKGKLLKPLLSSIKSSNAAIRNGAVQAFRDIVLHCHDLEALGTVADEVLSPLKSGKLSSADHRVLHSEMLEVLPFTVKSAELVATGLAAVSGKEGNETALAAETSALARAVIQLSEKGGQMPKPLLDTLAKGLSEKKPVFRKIWLLRVGDILQKQGDFERTSGIQTFVETTVPKLIETFEEVKKNVSSASQNGLVVGVYILIALSPSLQDRFSESKALAKLPKPIEALGPGAKEYTLLSHRVCSRLSGEEELLWLSLALVALAKQLDDKTEGNLRLAWSEALTFIITTSGIPSKVQQETAKLLSDLYLRSPRQISTWIIDGLWNLIAHRGETDKEIRFGREQVIQVVKSICPARSRGGEATTDPSILQEQACALLVLSQPVLVPRSGWIALCLRMGVDPGELAHSCLDKLLEEITIKASDEVCPLTLHRFPVATCLPFPPEHRTSKSKQLHTTLLQSWLLLRLLLLFLNYLSY